MEGEGDKMLTDNVKARALQKNEKQSINTSQSERDHGW